MDIKELYNPHPNPDVDIVKMKQSKLGIVLDYIDKYEPLTANVTAIEGEKVTFHIFNHELNQAIDTTLDLSDMQSALCFLDADIAYDLSSKNAAPFSEFTEDLK